MSLINKVLQDLDQRDRLPSGDAPPQQVRAVGPDRQWHEWFWWLIGLLMIIALAWVAWIAYQLQPASIATPSAFKAAEEARQKQEAAGRMANATASAAALVKPAEPAVRATAPSSAKPSADAPGQGNPLAEPAPGTARKPAVSAESMKLALSIDTPIQPAKTPAAGAATGRSQPDVSQAQSAPASDHRPARLERKEREAAPADRAEREFRRGVALLREGRAREAEETLGTALALNPLHEGARQAFVASLLERQRLPEAAKLLEEGLALNPNHLGFRTVLARIRVERGEYERARETLSPFQAAAKENAEFGLLLGNVEQRLGRHAEAAEAFRVVLDADGANAPAWVGLGVSLEALGRRADAAEAFRRSIAAGPRSADLRNFAEQRMRSLR